MRRRVRATRSRGAAARGSRGPEARGAALEPYSVAQCTQARSAWRQDEAPQAVTSSQRTDNTPQADLAPQYRAANRALPSPTSANAQLFCHQSAHGTPPGIMMRLDASACMEPFSEYTSRKTDICGLIFRVDDPREPHAFQLDRSIQKSPERCSEQDWANFCAELPADDCRMGLVSVTWDAADGHRASKSVFVLWSPSQAPIKTKMIYSASSASLKSALQGAGVNYQAGDAASLEWSAVVEKAKSSVTAR